MSQLTPHQAFVLYQGILRHFKDEFDFFKYNGKLRGITPSSFSRHKDRFVFEKIARRFDERELIDFYISNIISGVTYVRDFHEDAYYEYKRRKEAQTYHFSNELEAALEKSGPSLFQSEAHQYPKIVQCHLSRMVSMETLSILNHYFGFLKGSSDPLLDDLYLKSTKLFPFLKFDKEKIENILHERL